MEHRQSDPASVGKSQGAQGTQKRLLIQSKGSGMTFQVWNLMEKRFLINREGSPGRGTVCKRLGGEWSNIYSFLHIPGESVLLMHFQKQGSLVLEVCGPRALLFYLHGTWAKPYLAEPVSSSGNGTDESSYHWFVLKIHVDHQVGMLCIESGMWQR